MELMQTKSTPSDLVVFLDMDRTLVFTEVLDDRDEEACDGKAVLFSTLEPGDDGRKVIVYKRPKLYFFLQEVSARFAEVHIFTAAWKDYADGILDRLDPAGTIFTKRWYRDSCTGPETDFRKDVLSLAGIDVNPKRFVLVDDNEFYMLDNPCNGIVVAEFNQRSLAEEDDDVLLKVLRLLDELDGYDDVRPYLKNRFELPMIKTMFESNGTRMGATPIR